MAKRPISFRGLQAPLRGLLKLPAILCLAATLLLGIGCLPGEGARAAEPTSAEAGKPFTICKKQTYALCATAKCTVLDGVSYCKCDVEHGDSISLTDPTDEGDICTFNAQGEKNGYMVSTFSPPPSVQKPNGDQAVYDCDKSTSTGAYAQCDGGVCFKSTRGQNFPGFPEKLKTSEIICSCPAVVADPDTAKIGFQIVGPYPCEKKFFNYCNAAKANTDNGSSLYVGAPTGSARFLSRKLTGQPIRLNRCTMGG